MFNPYKRARTFYYKNQPRIHFVAGVGMGVGATLYCVRTMPKELVLPASPEMVKGFTENADGNMWWKLHNGSFVTIVKDKAIEDLSA